jgi:hypothetical protein
LLAYFNNSWHEVGDEITTLTFNMDWDICADNVPDGPVSLALRAWDKAGNQTLDLPGLTHIIKEYSCESAHPACTPAADQIAIFSDVDYHGNCQIFDLGEYANPDSFSAIGDNDVESIIVGSNVLAELFGNPDFTGRSETLMVDDSNLDDNLIGGNKLSSFKVSSRSDRFWGRDTIPGLPGRSYGGCLFTLAFQFILESRGDKFSRGDLFLESASS